MTPLNAIFRQATMPPYFQAKRDARQAPFLLMTANPDHIKFNTQHQGQTAPVNFSGIKLKSSRTVDNHHPFNFTNGQLIVELVQNRKEIEAVTPYKGEPPAFVLPLEILTPETGALQRKINQLRETPNILESKKLWLDEILPAIEQFGKLSEQEQIFFGAAFLYLLQDQRFKNMLVVDEVVIPWFAENMPSDSDFSNIFWNTLLSRGFKYPHVRVTKAGYPQVASTRVKYKNPRDFRAHVRTMMTRQPALQKTPFLREMAVL